MKYKNILFDLDNTLFDFDKAEENSLKSVFKEYDVEFSKKNLNAYRKINIKMWEEMERGVFTRDEILTKRFDIFFEGIGRTVDSEEVEKLFRKNLDLNSQLIDGAVEVLETLKNKDVKLYTASNGVYSTQERRMKDSGIMKFFDKNFISERVGHEKPSKLFFKYCYENIDGASLKNTLMVGDILNADIVGANNFGFDSCYFDRKGNGGGEIATYVINDLRELLEIVK